MQQDKQRPTRRFRILRKLLVLSAILIGFLLLVGILSYANLAYQKTTIDTIVNEKFSDLVKVSAMSRKILSAHNELARVVRWVALGYMSGSEAEAAIGQQARAVSEIDAEDLAGLSDLTPSERRELSAWIGEYEEWLAQIREIIDKDHGLAELYLGSADEIVVQLVATLAALEAQYSRESHRYIQESGQGLARAIVAFFVILAVAVVVSISVAYWIGKSIVVPLTALANKASAISAQRDLSGRIELRSNDEVGVLASAFNSMIVSLKEYYDELLDNQGRLEQARKALEDLNANLELEVARRTAQLRRTNEQMSSEIDERIKAEAALRSAKQEAEAANQAKSAFLASMSHELRTPLNGILGYAQILQRDSGLDKAHGNGIRIIRDSGEHLLSLINDILDMAKIEAGRLELTLSDFSLPVFFEDLAELFGMRASEKGLAFRYQATTTLAQAVHGDERRLRQVCFNLLGNAIKFTDDGGVTLEVGFEPGRLRVSVHDQGCGIAPGKLEEIFLPFHQTGDQRYRAKGTGLGLAITKRLVEAMGGQMQVKSQPGRGSCFSFDIPLLEAVGALSELTERMGRAIVGLDGGECRVLVVDDRPHNRALLLDLLRPLGFRVEEAVDGKEALSRVDDLRPQLILLDLLMPTMDGFEFARRLRQLPEHQGTVVIAVSASVMDGQSQEALSAGCNAFLPKPIHADSLLAEMEKWLGLKWRYAQETWLPRSETRLDSVEPGKIMGPPPGHIAELCKLADEGDVQGVIDFVGDELAGDPALQPFTRHVQMLAGGFRERELISFLESFASDGAA